MFLLDQDHIEAGKRAATTVGGGCVGALCSKIAEKAGHIDFAYLVNVATFFFVLMQMGLLVPKYVIAFRRWQERRAAAKAAKNDGHGGV